MPILKGAYYYRVDGVIQVTEPWQIVRQGGRHWHIHVDRKVNGVTALSLKANITTRCKTFVFAYHAGQGRGQTLTCEYRLDQKGIHYTLDCRGGWRLASSAKPLFFPLMRLWTGPSVTKLAQAGGTGEVLVPSIRNPDDPEGLFTPLTSTRKVWPDSEEAGLFHYEGGEYDLAVPVRINAFGLMTSYCWQTREGAEWLCELELSQSEERSLKSMPSLGEIVGY